MYMRKRILVGSLALCAAVSFVVPRNAAGQASAPAAADSELVGELAKQLGSSTQQAEGAAGALFGLASVAGTFTKLGLKPGDALKAVPVLTNFVGKKGGAEAAKLLAGALK
jgi:hypothetical protein